MAQKDIIQAIQRKKLIDVKGLCEKLDISKNTVTRSVYQLLKFNFIEVVKKDDNKGRFFRLKEENNNGKK